MDCTRCHTPIEGRVVFGQNDQRLHISCVSREYPAAITHFTYTGYSAGQPFCEVNKREHPEDRYIHMPYNTLAMDRELANPDLCPGCRREYDAAGEEN